MKALKTKVDRILSISLVALMAIMVVNVLWQVASRYLVGSPSLFTDELANFLLIWVGLLGAAYAAGQHNHLAIDILPNKLTGKKKKALKLVLGILTILFALTIMVIGGIRLVYLTLVLDQLSATLQVPLGYVYLVLPVSGLLIIFYALHDLKTEE